MEPVSPMCYYIICNQNMNISTYRKRTKFRGINFRALAGSEFRGSIFSWTHGAREAKSTSSYVAIQEM